MALTRDLYNILQVSPSASTEEIRKAFRKLAMQYHPDRNPGSATAGRQFAEIQEAYSILSDRKKRADYNRERYANDPGFQTQSQPTTAAEVQQLFNTFFMDFSRMDPFRLDLDWLYYRLTALASDNNLALLSGSDNSQIRKQTFEALHLLPYHQAKEIAARLQRFSANDPSAIKEIHQFLIQARQYAFWTKYKVWIALMLALLFCFLLFFTQ
jgi:curved DNA-binding protein CbpA